MDLYIKPKKKVLIIKRKIIYLKDICESFFSGNIDKNNIDNIIITKINTDKDCEMVISVIDIIRKINLNFENITVSNLGESETLVEYQTKQRNNSKFIEGIKVLFVSFILFTGAATAIMSFHSDAQMPEIFDKFYYIFLGEYSNNTSIIAIPYTIGLGVGIIVFFNHFSKKYITKDPTPIEVQMTTYEKETIESIIDTLEKSVNNNE